MTDVHMFGFLCGALLGCMIWLSIIWPDHQDDCAKEVSIPRWEAHAQGTIQTVTHRTHTSKRITHTRAETAVIGECGRIPSPKEITS